MPFFRPTLLHLCVTIFLLAATVPDAVRAAATCNGPLKVAIDVGHSAKTWGATSARGRKEHDFNFRFANELVVKSKTWLNLQLTLIQPKITGLTSRATEARRVGAGAFFSIHHDAVNKKYLDWWEYGGKKLAYSDKFRGHSIFVSRKNADFKGSRALADLVGRQMADRGLKPTLHHAEKIPGEGRELLDEKLGIYEADFTVIAENELPAILFEVGVIVHRGEEELLDDPAHRSKIQLGLLTALEEFCRQRSGPNP
jgi:N-acetylmuramoyl-L-alanine amidase